jgi:hypothetical protein
MPDLSFGLANVRELCGYEDLQVIPVAALAAEVVAFDGGAVQGIAHLGKV